MTLFLRGERRRGWAPHIAIRVACEHDDDEDAAQHRCQRRQRQQARPQNSCAWFHSDQSGVKKRVGVVVRSVGSSAA